MRWGLTVMVLGCLLNEAQAATVCRIKSTEQVVETYAHDAPGICLKNLVTDNPQYGFLADDVEELIVSEGERLQMIAAWQDHPNNPESVKRSARNTLKGKTASARAKLKTATGLSDEELDALGLDQGGPQPSIPTPVFPPGGGPTISPNDP